MDVATLLSETTADLYSLPNELREEDLGEYAADTRKALNRLVNRIKALPVADGGDPNVPQVPPPPPA